MKIYAHRGFSHKFPEATFASYQGAIDVGADGLECDVRLTKDGVAVCFHDRDTARLAGIKKRVATLTLSELREIVAVMTLEELLELAKRNSRSVLVETKHPVLTRGAVDRAVIDLSSRFSFTAMSFSFFAVRRFQKKLDDVAYVISRRWRLIYIPTNKVAVDIELYAKSSWVRNRLAKKEVLLWTINDLSYLARLREWNVAGVITDRPDLPFRVS